MFSATLLLLVSMQAPHHPQIDPVGTWRHSPDASWTITAAADGSYQAQETGLGNASGPAHFTASGLFHIDYVTRDGAIVGIYEVRFAPDGRGATGTVRELNGPRRSGTTSWTRVVVQPPPPPVAAPAPAPTPAPQPQAPLIDPSGSWTHSPNASWSIRAIGGGRFEAVESGLGFSSGPAYFTPAGTFRIEYTTRDRSTQGIYEVRFSPDGRTATGSVQELTGPRRSGPTNWTHMVPTAQPAPPVQPAPPPAPARPAPPVAPARPVAAAQVVDPSGTWRHHPQGTWTLTRAPDGRFMAQETGLGNATGMGYFTPNGTFHIDYTTRDRAISGVYDIRFSPDGRSATGTIQELNGPRRSGTTTWSR